MEPFTYQFKGESYNSRAIPYKENGCQRYRITLPNEHEFVIAPSGILSSNGKIIWVQPNKPVEVIQPHELVQAIGEGIEAAGVPEGGAK